MQRRNYNPCSVFISIATALVLVGCASEIVEDCFPPPKLIWSGGPHHAGTSLAYGVAESDVLLIFFLCDSTTRRITVSVPLFDFPASDGESFVLTLKSGEAKMDIDATAFVSALDEGYGDVTLHGRIESSKRLGDILGGGEMLTLNAGNQFEDIPLAGATEAAKPLIENCSVL